MTQLYPLHSEGRKYSNLEGMSHFTKSRTFLWDTRYSQEEGECHGFERAKLGTFTELRSSEKGEKRVLNLEKSMADQKRRDEYGENVFKTNL